MTIAPKTADDSNGVVTINIYVAMHVGKIIEFLEILQFQEIH